MPDLNKRARIAVAASGRGRTIENLLGSQTNFEICGVIVNKTCRAENLADEQDIPVYKEDFTTPDLTRLDQWLNEQRIDYIALCGFLKKFPSLRRYTDKVINIHPALLPKFGGKGMYGDHVHKAVIAAGEKESGATIHFVNEHYDEGHVISQIKVAITANETPHSLAAKVFDAECLLYPWTLEKIISGELPLRNHQVAIYEP